MSDDVKSEMALIDLVSRGVFTFKQLETDVSLNDVQKVLALESFKNANMRER